MKVSVDTNILVRAAARDNAQQATLAANILRNEEAIVVPVISLCEFVWVMRQGI